MKKNNGFSLVELAVVLMIVGLLMGGVIMGLTAQIEQRRYSDTQKGLEDIKEALIGYAIQHGHLPCPDRTTGGGATANDGQEDVTAGGVCTTQVGNIPWATLGVSDFDAWGHRYHYAVTPVYSNRTPSLALLHQSSPGTLSVCQTTTAPAGTCVTPIALALPAVVLSFGPNGLGAITNTGAPIANATGPAATPPANNADEYQNWLVTATVFVSHPKSAAGGALGEFDDQVAWLSSATLISRMKAVDPNSPPLP